MRGGVQRTMLALQLGTFLVERSRAGVRRLPKGADLRLLLVPVLTVLLQECSPETAWMQREPQRSLRETEKMPEESRRPSEYIKTEKSHLHLLVIT